jgi:tripartite-type tricarboxylate transporter receptor subunit TctC
MEELSMTRLTRRSFSAGALAAGIAAPHVARAQAAYPAPGSTLKIVVGFPPGGSQDITGRIVADRLGALWNVTTVVENVAGAGANIAMDRVAKGAGDGTQILIAPPGIVTNQFLYSRLAFDPEKDLIPIGQVSTQPNLLCVKKDLAVNSVAELIAYAKANPGKLNYASTGIGTTTHLGGELFKKMANVDIKVVHYRGSSPALNDLLAGNVDVMFDNISSIVPHARAGSVRPLAVSSAKRLPLAPEFPTIGDTVTGYQTTSWAGLAVRAGTPKEICDKIEAGNKAICKDPLLVSRLNGTVTEAVGSGAKEFAEFIASERATWGKLITDLRIKVGD